jgi:hypothetical protein
MYTDIVLAQPNNDKSEEITVSFKEFDPLPKLEFRINTPPDAAFDTGPHYVTIGALDTASTVNIKIFTPCWTNTTDTFYKDVPLTLLGVVETVKTDVCVAMRIHTKYVVSLYMFSLIGIVLNFQTRLSYLNPK